MAAPAQASLLAFSSGDTKILRSAHEDLDDRALAAHAHVRLSPPAAAMIETIRRAAKG